MKAVLTVFRLAVLRRACCAAGLALVAASQASAAPAASLVPGASRIAFVTRQMGAPVEGAFTSFDAHVAFDPQRPEGGSVALEIDVASAALGVPQADSELPKPAWFDAARYPKASFRSRLIRRLASGEFEVTGTLTIKGRSQELVVPVSIAQSGGQSVATGRFTIQRLSFRIGEGEWTDTSMIGDDVQVRVRLVLTGLSPI